MQSLKKTYYFVDVIFGNILCFKKNIELIFQQTFDQTDDLFWLFLTNYLECKIIIINENISTTKYVSVCPFI